MLPALLLLLCSQNASAATLCVENDTLAQYISAGSCYVNAGLGVQVLFSFLPGAYQFNTDSPTLNVLASDITVQKVTGPGSPEAGLKFNVSNLTVPADGTFVDVNLTFGVSIYFQPLGKTYLFKSAHLGINDVLASDPSAVMIGVESENIQGSFNLQLIDPSDPSDVTDQDYIPVLTLQPNVDISTNVPGSKVTSWVESFDLVALPEPASMALIPGALILMGLLRKRKLVKSILPLVAVAVVMSGTSHAAPLCTDLNAINGAPVGPGTTSLGMDKYIAYSAQAGNPACQMGDMLFRFQSFSASGTGVTLATAANTKLVFTLNNSTPTATQLVGIQYIPQATSTGTQTQQFSFTYTVVAPVYKVTKLTGATSGTLGNVTRKLTVTPGATPSPTTTLSPNVAINDPINTLLTVTEQITFSAAAGTKHISNLTETFTEITPEPLTSILMGSALLGIGLLARKRRQA